MAPTWDERQFTREPSKSQGDTYSVLKDDVRSFIENFYNHILNLNADEIENDYQTRFPRLTEKYFMTSRWPSLDLVRQVVEKDDIFFMLYNELYYRHVYARVSGSLTVEDMWQSYLNYCALFNTLIKTDKPVRLELPNSWLWDIIDEFLYQFQKFSSFRARQKHKSEDELLLRQNPRMWNIHSVLNVLHSLIEKSGINEQLSYYATTGNPDTIAGEFGRVQVYKMLGFFSLIGLCRLHCLLGDYYTAVKALENIIISRLEMYHEVPTCHITTGYYVGFAYLMMRRYQDAIRIFSSTLEYKSKAIGLISQRADLREYVAKQSDQMSSLLAVCLTINPAASEHAMEPDRRDKSAETLARLQQLDEMEFINCFDVGCPKFVSPETPAYARPALPNTTTSNAYTLEPQRQQLELFKVELTQQLELLRLRSYLKLYTNLPTTKLAGLNSTAEPSVHTALMAHKFRLKQVASLVGDADNGLAGGDPVSANFCPDLDFFVDGCMIHIADTKVDRRFSEYFIRQIEMLQQLNTSLDSIERRLHDAATTEIPEALRPY